MAPTSKTSDKNAAPGQIFISRSVFGQAEKISSVAQLAGSLLNLAQTNSTDLLETLFIGAIDLDASDLHLEPEKEAVKIRLRLDGLLQDVEILKPEVFRGLLSRLKLVSGIKLNVSHRPQDGRFSLVDGANSIEVRISTLPSEHGETAVLRLLNPKKLITLEELGLRPDLLTVFRREISRPNGMIIVTGPTGSGKTTTLYAFLKAVQKPEIKIVTIEDPIEYHLPGISQTQVDSAHGYDFASGLKAIVRQDPDVILVGEIRDGETAQIALQAALTGHLVFTTLHTNDAAGTVARLINLGAEPATIASAANFVIAQRLVRRVCQKCVRFSSPSAAVLLKIQKVLAGIRRKTKLTTIKIACSQGCSECNFTGYQGRLGVFEAWLVDPDMEEIILSKPSSEELKRAAIEKGMVTMYQDGWLRALEGLTTIEEIERIVGPDEN
jgi:type II secretory ATPase GspE/PulE/Tfp pilus assembly ATPase PilB-like protein